MIIKESIELKILVFESLVIQQYRPGMHNLFKIRGQKKKKKDDVEDQISIKIHELHELLFFIHIQIKQ